MKLLQYLVYLLLLICSLVYLGDLICSLVYLLLLVFSLVFLELLIYRLVFLELLIYSLAYLGVLVLAFLGGEDSGHLIQTSSHEVSHLIVRAQSDELSLEIDLLLRYEGHSFSSSKKSF